MSSLTDAISGILRIRQEDASAEAEEAGALSVTIDCDAGNEYDGRMGLRISSIFVILVGSLLGALLPVVLARHSKMKAGPAFFVAKYFGSGVIIGTAFMHLLSPAYEALSSPCLPEGGITSYDWAAGICLMTIFVMFTIELLASRFDIFGGHSHDDVEAADPSVNVLKKSSQTSTSPTRNQSQDTDGNNMKEPKVGNESHTGEFNGLPTDVSYPPGGEDHLGHHREHSENDSYSAFAAQMMAIFILEFGVIFHSIFIGLTLAVSGDEFRVLYIVLVFHQTFEGLGLGSRLATAAWPRRKWFMPYLLATMYAVSTPISIAAGLGVRESLEPGSPTTLIVNGVFDAISAGILIYTGLVELLAHEFMFNSQMRNAGLKVQLFALGCVALGCGLMAVLAKWA
ncbi:low-affinity Zn(2+) transporter zrt2 [Diatrype stigma]|uniref:Low-affinity Zn(2+) transporter zrt2 n=1 Tax=Diatrype stigma TaxID=117547 RepID=A0AAN9UMY9_9PEZI